MCLNPDSTLKSFNIKRIYPSFKVQARNTFTYVEVLFMSTIFILVLKKKNNKMYVLKCIPSNSTKVETPFEVFIVLSQMFRNAGLKNKKECSQ